MKKKLYGIATAALLVVATGTGLIGTTLAYMTDAPDRLINKYTIALDVTSKIVEKFDTSKIDTTTPVIQYEKSVAVINSSFVDEYVRVRIDFSDSKIRGNSEFTQDGKTWYSWDEFIKKVGNGWIYNSSDGYFYYTGIVKAGDWETVSKDSTGILAHDTSDNHYQYKDGKDESNIKSVKNAPDITTKLITGIRTDFRTVKDGKRVDGTYENMTSYDVYVYDESCPYYMGSDYSSAWKNYEANNLKPTT